MSILLGLILSAFAASLPDATRDGIAAARDWSRERVTQAERAYRAARLPSPDFWGREVIYQIQLDRFANGDTGNDSLNVDPAQAAGDYDRVLDFRHGGDLRGVTRRLDYIRDLGATVMWITPFLKHDGSYHGYCTTDPTQIDPGFGNLEDLRELVREAHARGLRVVMDVVINHLCDRATSYAKPADHYACAASADRKNWSGEPGPADAQGELAFADSFFGPLKSRYFFNRCGANSDADMRGTDPVAIYGDFVAGMFDYDTRNQDFQYIFTNLFKYWIAAADVDGFRLDAAKHVTEDFVAYFSSEARAYARSLGKDGFLVLGEVPVGGAWIRRRLGRMQDADLPRTLTSRLRDLRYADNPRAPYPGLDAVYEFAQGGTAVDVLYGQRPTRDFEDHFRGDFAGAIGAVADHRLSWNLLEIHDWSRFASRPGATIGKSILGAAYLAFAEGSPIFYYGFEQGFSGRCVGHYVGAVGRTCADGGDALNRQDMFAGGMSRLGSVVPAIDALAYIGPPRSERSADPFLDTSHELFRATRRFLGVRRSCSALGYGFTKFRWSEDGGLLAFSRLDPNNGHEALVILNAGPRARALPEMRVEASGAKWRNLLGAETASRSGDRLTFAGVEIPADGAMVFVPAEQVDARPGAPVCRD